MQITESRLREIIMEELTKADKDAITRMIKKELKAMVEDEVAKAIKSKQIKDDIGDISKKILKKLYKDMSVHHPYIIDRIKVWFRKGVYYLYTEQKDIPMVKTKILVFSLSALATTGVVEVREQELPKPEVIPIPYSSVGDTVPVLPHPFSPVIQCESISFDNNLDIDAINACAVKRVGWLRLWASS